jgi:hypothetical protein
MKSFPSPYCPSAECEYEASPPLFPDFIDGLRFVHNHDYATSKLWHLGDNAPKLDPPSDYSHLRGALVAWEHPCRFVDDVPPWRVTLTHYHQVFVGQGKKLQLRQRVNVVTRRFRDRASCAAFAERLLRRIEAVNARWDAHYHPKHEEAA